MVKRLSISEARKRITSLADELAFDDAISITNHGKEVFALLRWETYESIAETLEILSDEKALEEQKEGIAQYTNNELIDLDEFRNALDV